MFEVWLERVLLDSCLADLGGDRLGVCETRAVEGKPCSFLLRDPFQEFKGAGDS